MSDFAPGDVVVCVDASSPPTRVTISPSELRLAMAFLREGKTYRISTVPDAESVRLVGDPIPPGVFGGYDAKRFRKIDKADDSFTKTVRACTPIKHREKVA